MNDSGRASVHWWHRLANWVIMSPVVWVVALADLAGSLAGYSYWYGSTILASPWYYWVFVPDCPLAATLMGAALLAYHFGRKWDVLGVIAAAMCIKYGLWTVVSWVVEFARGGPFGLEGVTMAVTHLLLLVQGLMLCTRVRYRWVAVLIASLFIVGNDLVDYVAGQYPRLPDSVGVRPMRALAVGTTAALVMVYWSTTWISARRTRIGRGPVEAGAAAKGEGSDASAT